MSPEGRQTRILVAIVTLIHLLILAGIVRSVHHAETTTVKTIAGILLPAEPALDSVARALPVNSAPVPPIPAPLPRTRKPPAIAAAKPVQPAPILAVASDRSLSLEQPITPAVERPQLPVAQAEPTQLLLTAPAPAPAPTPAPAPAPAACAV